MRVSFTPLVGPQCSELHPPARQRLALQGPRWGIAPPQAFPPSFINVAVALWHAAMRAHDSLPAKLPWDVWALHILPCLAHDDFEKQRPSMFAIGNTKLLSQAAAGSGRKSRRLAAKRGADPR